MPTYPELTCHSLEDLRDPRLAAEDLVPRGARRASQAYEETVIPYWRGRSLRDRMFAAAARRVARAYGAGVFTEFMEQRAPGHTVLDDKIYRKGMLDFREDIARAPSPRSTSSATREALDRREQLDAMDIACDALILFAERHAALAERIGRDERRSRRAAPSCERSPRSAGACPAHAPRDFHEALQTTGSATSR